MESSGRLLVGRGVVKKAREPDLVYSEFSHEINILTTSIFQLIGMFVFLTLCTHHVPHCSAIKPRELDPIYSEFSRESLIYH
jgi:hypothetical protein